MLDVSLTVQILNYTPSFVDKELAEIPIYHFARLHLEPFEQRMCSAAFETYLLKNWESNCQLGFIDEVLYPRFVAVLIPCECSAE